MYQKEIIYMGLYKDGGRLGSAGFMKVENRDRESRLSMKIQNLPYGISGRFPIRVYNGNDWKEINGITIQDGGGKWEENLAENVDKAMIQVMLAGGYVLEGKSKSANEIPVRRNSEISGEIEPFKGVALPKDVETTKDAAASRNIEILNDAGVQSEHNVMNDMDMKENMHIGIQDNRNLQRDKSIQEDRSIQESWSTPNDRNIHIGMDIQNSREIQDSREAQSGRSIQDDMNTQSGRNIQDSINAQSGRSIQDDMNTQGGRSIQDSINIQSGRGIQDDREAQDNRTVRIDRDIQEDGNLQQGSSNTQGNRKTQKDIAIPNNANTTNNMNTRDNKNVPRLENISVSRTKTVDKVSRRGHVDAVRSARKSPQTIIITEEMPRSAREKAAVMQYNAADYNLKEDKWEQILDTYEQIHPYGDERVYVKLEPKDFVILQSNYQHLVNNSFLLHGFYNYRYVILGKEGDYYLGVPGVFYEREKMVALMFGFEAFECPGGVARAGEFGYYLRKVEL